MIEHSHHGHKLKLLAFCNARDSYKITKRDHERIHLRSLILLHNKLITNLKTLLYAKN